MLSPTSEATVQLVGEKGLENVGDETFTDVLASVQAAVPPDALVGLDPAAGAATATRVARVDDAVQRVLGRVLQHDVPPNDTRIDPAGDQDLYKFSLDAPATVILQVARSSGDLAPCIEVVPMQKMCGTDSVRLDLTLSPGTYQVFVSGQSPSQVGAYRIYYLRLRLEDAAGLPADTAVLADIDPGRPVRLG